jgi:hypothetical protein
MVAGGSWQSAWEEKMSETETERPTNYRQPPLHSRFQKGQSGNPRGRPAKSLPGLLVAALDEPVYVTSNGKRRKITKREAVIAQLVNKSAGADLRATKMLIDMMKDIEKKAGVAPPPEPPLTPADEEVIEQFVAWLRRQIAAEAAGDGAEASDRAPCQPD